MSDNQGLLTAFEAIEYDQMVFNYCRGIIDANVNSLKIKILTEDMLPEVSLYERYLAIKALDVVRNQLIRIIRNEHRCSLPTNNDSRLRMRVGITGKLEYSVDVSRKEFDNLKPWDAAELLFVNLIIK